MIIFVSTKVRTLNSNNQWCYFLWLIHKKNLSKHRAVCYYSCECKLGTYIKQRRIHRNNIQCSMTHYATLAHFLHWDRPNWWLYMDRVHILCIMIDFPTGDRRQYSGIIVPSDHREIIIFKGWLCHHNHPHLPRIIHSLWSKFKYDWILPKTLFDVFIE